MRFRSVWRSMGIDSGAAGPVTRDRSIDMCGIFGAIGPVGAGMPVSESEATRMRDAMSSRGPDGSGLYIHGHVVLAHRRLAIRDINAPAQPWLSEDGQIAVVFNGEIYNDCELRTELSQQGFRFRTRCDTELIPAAYRCWGDAFVDRLRGDFAIGLYDFSANRLSLIRDRCGAKPLFFGWVGDVFLFASSIRALRGHPGLTAKPNWSVLSHYLTTLRLTLGRETVYEGIEALGPGERLELRSGNVSIHSYWEPPFEADHNDFESAADAFESRLRESVRLRMAGDVGAGLFLSGGVDSSTLACMVKDEVGKRLPVGCGVGGEQNSSELSDDAFATVAARHFGHELTTVRVDSRHYRETWLGLLQDYATPISTPTDAILFQLSADLATSAGFVLGGEGADELLCGYAVPHFSGHDYDRSERLAAGGWSPSPHVNRLFRESLHRGYGRERFATAGEHYFALNSLIPSAAKSALLRPAVWNAAQHDARMNAWYNERLSAGRGRSPTERLTRLLHRVNLEALLSRLDSASMRAGLEVRPVYADHHLVEETFRLPERFKIGIDAGEPAPFLSSVDLAARGSLRDKRLLRSIAARFMPRKLAYRPKASFPTPVADWLTNDWSHWVSETLRRSPFAEAMLRPDVRQKLAARPEQVGFWLWPLMNVVLWGDQQFCGRGPEIAYCGAMAPA